MRHTGEVYGVNTDNFQNDIEKRGILARIARGVAANTNNKGGDPPTLGEIRDFTEEIAHLHGSGSSVIVGEGQPDIVGIVGAQRPERVRKLPNGWELSFRRDFAVATRGGVAVAGSVKGEGTYLNERAQTKERAAAKKKFAFLRMANNLVRGCTVPLLIVAIGSISVPALTLFTDRGLPGETTAPSGNIATVPSYCTSVIEGIDPDGNPGPRVSRLTGWENLKLVGVTPVPPIKGEKIGEIRCFQPQ
jgi:hypothetical protein